MHIVCEAAKAEGASIVAVGCCANLKRLPVLGRFLFILLHTLPVQRRRTEGEMTRGIAWWRTRMRSSMPQPVAILIAVRGRLVPVWVSLHLMAKLKLEVWEAREMDHC